MYQLFPVNATLLFIIFENTVLIYLTNQSMQPLSVMFNPINTDSTGVAFAVAALYLLPMLLIYLYFQDDILLGVQLSELK